MPCTRAAITRGPPSGLKPARILPGSGIVFTWSTGMLPDWSELDSKGMKSMAAPAFLPIAPAEATVT